MLFVAAALASSAPAAPIGPVAPALAPAVDTADECSVHPKLRGFHPDRTPCAPKLSPEGYQALDLRHRKTAAIGFTISGLGVPVFLGGIGVMALSSGFGFGDANAGTALGANIMGVGLAMHVTGAIVGFRSAKLYSIEYDELEQGTASPEDVLARGYGHRRHRVRLFPTGTGVAGVF